jgi:hypothetical protein
MTTAGCVLSDAIAKKEWKKLRDGYREAKKRMKNKSGTAQTNLRPWKFFELMRWLDDYAVAKPHDSNYTDDHADENNELDRDDCNIEEEVDNPEEVQNTDDATNASTSSAPTRLVYMLITAGIGPIVK